MEGCEAATASEGGLWSPQTHPKTHLSMHGPCHGCDNATKTYRSMPEHPGRATLSRFGVMYFRGATTSGSTPLGQPVRLRWNRLAIMPVWRRRRVSRSRWTDPRSGVPGYRANLERRCVRSTPERAERREYGRLATTRQVPRFPYCAKPYSRSPASPRPGTMYPTSLSRSSRAAQTRVQGTPIGSTSSRILSTPSGAAIRQMQVM